MTKLSDHIRNYKLKKFVSVGAIFPYMESDKSSESMLNFLSENPDKDLNIVTIGNGLTKVDFVNGYYFRNGNVIYYKDPNENMTSEILELPPNYEDMEIYVVQLRKLMIEGLTKLFKQLDHDDQIEIHELICNRYEKHIERVRRESENDQ